MAQTKYRWFQPYRPSRSRRPAANLVSQSALLTYEELGGERHRDRGVEHSHPHTGPHFHPEADHRTHPHPRDHGHSHSHGHDGHGHSHGLIHDTIKRSREGVRAVSLSLAVLGAAEALQTAVFVLSGSVALLADLIHNFGDALTAVPRGTAFLKGSERAERNAGLAVVAAIFISACVAGAEAIQRLIHPSSPGHLTVLAAAGAIGSAGNWIAARIRTRAGNRLNSPALIADGAHARADAYVSLAVIASAIVVAIGLGSETH